MKAMSFTDRHFYLFSPARQRTLIFPIEFSLDEIVVQTAMALDFILMSMPFVPGAGGTPPTNGCPCHTSTIGWRNSSPVIACSAC